MSTPSSLSILVVDDVPLNLKMAEGFLSILGYSVATALNSHEALKLLAENSYDLIFTDMYMPDMTGADLARKVKEQTPEATIILMSGDDDIQNQQDLNDIIDGYLFKPYTKADFQAMITKFYPD